jgi:hypothetical protein
MKGRFQIYVLRDSHAPLSTLAGVGLLIMASSRLAFALVVVAALLWVYGLTFLSIFFAKPIFPKIGRNVVFILLLSLMGSLFLYVIWIINPLLTMGTVYLIMLVPCYCIGSEIFPQIDSLEIEEIFVRIILETGSLSVLIIGFALIREPIGFMSLSVPGGEQGIIELFHAVEANSFLPIRIVASSSGALLLLGYGLALFRSIKKQ